MGERGGGKFDNKTFASWETGSDFLGRRREGSFNGSSESAVYYSDTTLIWRRFNSRGKNFSLTGG